jgi:hypothetical protein
MELNCNLLQDKMMEKDKGRESNKPVVYLVREVTKIASEFRLTWLSVCFYLLPKLNSDRFSVLFPQVTEI